MIEGVKKITKLELLAPAKNLAIGWAAILAGADAVYIGGPDFGARSAAGNSWEDVGALIEFAHQYYAKVYLTLNTIFFDKEIEEVKKFIARAYELGADALIIQDLGILEMDLPPIPIFASTQCDNSGVEQVKFLAEAGISRIILARELNLSEIKNIYEQTVLTHPASPGSAPLSRGELNTHVIASEAKQSRVYKSKDGIASSLLDGAPRNDKKIDLEFFVHGALCVSDSGHCYFSQALCGKSANRGKCVQVCRQPFDLVDSEGKVLAQDKYLLSLKDLNLSASLSDLIDSGITSFKIEGRLKDLSYVANVTAKYRVELDKIIEASGGKYARASSGKIELGFEPDLDKTFNRGYSEYFLRGRKGEIISPLTQKSLGEFIGKVDSASHSHFTLDRRHDLKNADGVCWFDRDGVLVGTNINMVKDGKIYPNKVLPISVGAEIYRNENPAFEKAVARGVGRRIAVDYLIKESKNGLKIEAVDEDGNSVTSEFKIEKQLAEKAELAIKNWQEQLSKLGETIFYAREINFTWEKPVFVPLSILNDWRRKIIIALLKERLKNYPRLKVEHQPTSHPYFQNNLDYSFNVANKLAQAFYERHGVKKIEPAFELQNDYRGKKLMTLKHCLKYWLDYCPRHSKNSPNFKEPLYLIQDGHKFRLNFDCGNCLMEVYK